MSRLQNDMFTYILKVVSIFKEEAQRAHKAQNAEEYRKYNNLVAQGVNLVSRARTSEI